MAGSPNSLNAILLQCFCYWRLQSIMLDLHSQFVPYNPSQFGRTITARDHKCTYCLLPLLLRPVLTVSTTFSTNSLLGNFQTGPKVHPASYSVRTGVPSRGRKRPRRQVTHLHLMPTFGMNGAIPLLPLYSLMTWTGKTLPCLSK
jgi:hypothetical protein